MPIAQLKFNMCNNLCVSEMYLVIKSHFVEEKCKISFPCKSPGICWMTFLLSDHTFKSPIRQHLQTSLWKARCFWWWNPILKLLLRSAIYRFPANLLVFVGWISHYSQLWQQTATCKYEKSKSMLCALMRVQRKSGWNLCKAVFCCVTGLFRRRQETSSYSDQSLSMGSLWLLRCSVTSQA